MASITVKVPQGFPVGTTLEAHVDRVGDIRPQGTPVTTGVIAADGSLTLSGLTAGLPYQVGAVINGAWRSFLVQIATGTPTSLPETIAELLDQIRSVQGPLTTTQADSLLESGETIFETDGGGNVIAEWVKVP